MANFDVQLSALQFRSYTLTYIAYYLTVGAYVYGYYAPEGRIWGISLYHTLPSELFYTLIAFAIIAPPILNLVVKTTSPESSNRDDKGRFVWGYIVFSALAMAAFYVLRTKTHFGGDGYTLLGLLAEDVPLIKTREVGESLIHVWAKNLYGAGGREGALFSYQALSIISGGVYTLAALYGARKLFTVSLERALFALGICSSGALLLYFGYVENYSLLVTSLLIFGISGALALRGELPRWTLVPLAALCVWLHLLGAIVIPAMLYALVAGTRAGTKILSAPLWLRWTGVVVVLAMGVGALTSYYHESMFFQMALLLPWQTAFSHPEYSLFSQAHLIDLTNLALLLCPWAGLSLVALFSLRNGKSSGHSRILRFFVLFSVSAVLAVIALDPKLGMPRDWDLFSFAAPPLVLLFFYAVISSSADFKERATVASLAVTLGLVALAPRVATGELPEVAAGKFSGYLDLDRYRSRTGVQTLQDYYLLQGDSAKAKAQIADYFEKFPEVKLLRYGKSLANAGRIDSAMIIWRKVRAIAPDYASVYLNLGQGYMATKQYDSAQHNLLIADGLNPYNDVTQSALALLSSKLGNYEDARRRWMKLVESDKPPMSALVGLSQLAASEKNWDECERHLSRLIAYEKAPAEAYKTLGDLKLRAGKLSAARTYYQQAVQRGYDSSILIQFESRYGQSGR